MRCSQACRVEHWHINVFRPPTRNINFSGGFRSCGVLDAASLAAHSVARDRRDRDNTCKFRGMGGGRRGTASKLLLANFESFILHITVARLWFRTAIFRQLAYVIKFKLPHNAIKLPVSLSLSLCRLNFSRDTIGSKMKRAKIKKNGRKKGGRDWVTEGRGKQKR